MTCIQGAGTVYKERKVGTVYNVYVYRLLLVSVLTDFILVWFKVICDDGTVLHVNS